MLQAQNEIKTALLQLHGKQDFTVFNADSIARTAETVGETLNIMLLSTAVITLLVGGLGVMNIMLVSVVERTQEIGIRMAIGARRRDILFQFLLESLTLCLFGGLLGLLFAWLLCTLLIQLNLRIVPVFSWQVMVVAFVFSSLIGIVFGFFPARRAARLHPVDALSRD
jgi:macrolide transport system ATP-binding/permease protein